MIIKEKVVQSRFPEFILKNLEIWNKPDFHHSMDKAGF